MSWDPKAERIAAKAQAEQARAQAEVIRVQADIERRRAEADLKRQDRRERQRARQERRGNAAKAVRGHADKLVPAAAIGAPAVIAWNGQYEFAAEVMHLGLLSPLLPVAIEGSVLYCAMLAHQAIRERLPVGRYRAMTWGLAGVAASMNCWHGATESGGDITVADWQVGTMLGLTSLLGIGLLELTVALRQKAAAGRTAAEIRRALVRRLRYPRLSVEAAAIAAARGIDAEEAWRAAWVDRYGIGPASTRHERRAARQVTRLREKADRAAARAGELAIRDGVLVGPTEDAPGRPGPQSGGSGGDDRLDVREIALQEWAAAGLEEVDRFLRAAADAADAPGAVRELPPPARRPAPDAGSSLQRDEQPAADGGPAGEGKGGRRRPRLPGRRKDRKDRKSIRKGNAFEERLEAVRALLADNPDATGADIAAALKIPGPTARRLRTRVLDERKDGPAGGER